MQNISHMNVVIPWSRTYMVQFIFLLAVVTGLWIGRSGVRILAGERANMSKLALGPTLSPIQWALGLLCSCKAARA